MDETILCTDSIPTYIIFASDNCDNDVTITQTDSTSTQNDNDCFTITRSWLIEDNCGNTNTHTQVVTVQDNDIPTFDNAPVDETILCTDSIPTYIIIASDNCDNDVTITQTDSTSTQSNNDCFTITRSWLIEDNCGNTNTHT